MQDVEIDTEELVIGLFAIKLDTISVEGLKLMRCLLPKDEYKKVKDRKSARHIRRKRARRINLLRQSN